MGALWRQGSSGLWLPGQIKPQGVPRVDWAHPLAAGLVFYGFDTGQFLVVDLVRGRPMISGGSVKPSLLTSQWGTGFVYNGATTVVECALDAELNIVPPFSFACSYDQNATSPAFGQIFGRAAVSNASFSFNVNPASGGQNQVAFILGYPTTIGSTWTGNSQNSFNTLLGAVPSTSSASFYANGIPQGTSTGLTVGNPAGSYVGFGANNVGGANPYPGFVYWGAIWNRSLSNADAMSLHLDPYQFLLPPEGGSGIAR